MLLQQLQTFFGSWNFCLFDQLNEFVNLKWYSSRETQIRRISYVLKFLFKWINLILSSKSDSHEYHWPLQLNDSRFQAMRSIQKSWNAFKRRKFTTRNINIPSKLKDYSTAFDHIEIFLIAWGLLARLHSKFKIIQKASRLIVILGSSPLFANCRPGLNMAFDIH